MLINSAAAHAEALRAAAAHWRKRRDDGAAGAGEPAELDALIARLEAAAAIVDGTANDVAWTQRTTLEALRQSEARLRAMIEVVRDYAIFMLDVHGNIASWNSGAQRLKGYAAHEIIGRHFSTFYAEEDRARGHPAYELERAVAEGRYEEEGWRVRKDGTQFWANVVITAVFDQQRKHIGFTKVTRDFTERREAEDRLRQSEERLRLLVESVTDYAIFMLDPDGRVATWNTGARTIKGYEASEIIGRSLATFYPTADVEAGRPDRGIAIATREGRYEEEGWRVRKSGELFWANVVLTAVRDPRTGALRGFAKVTRDLTERRRMAEETQRALEAAAAERARVAETQNALQARDEFLSVAAHELRTPLTALQLKVEGVLKALRRGAPADQTAIDVEKHAARLEGALRQVKRFSELVERLLDVSRISRGRLGLNLEDTDVAAIARQVAEDFREPALHANSPITVEAPESLVGQWDRARLEQVLINLVSNALKYGAGKPVTVRVLGDAANTRARIEVEDHGIGIPAADVERVFARFERAAPVQNYAGLGLGLYIARNIVEAHGGTIHVESMVGEGSTFIVEMPLSARLSALSSPSRVLDSAQ